MAHGMALWTKQSAFSIPSPGTLLESDVGHATRCSLVFAADTVFFFLEKVPVETQWRLGADQVET